MNTHEYIATNRFRDGPDGPFPLPVRFSFFQIVDKHLKQSQIVMFAALCIALAHNIYMTIQLVMYLNKSRTGFKRSVYYHLRLAD